MKNESYEILQDRLAKANTELQNRLRVLDENRKAVFGTIPTELIATDRVSTEHNCLARDMISLGNGQFLFGYNVHMGLKSETHTADVFSIFAYQEDNHTFKAVESELLLDSEFVTDFNNLYKYYRDTQFVKFAKLGNHLFMVFQVGKELEDIKTFKWAYTKAGELRYVDNRSDHEYRYPDQHEFVWKKATRDMQRQGAHPHISIEDRLFVETIGGDLTLKIEDNTDTGKGIFQEPVEDPDQTLDDAELYYAIIGNLIALKIKPYQEPDFRYIIYNQKVQQATRIDGLEDSCVLLPDDQGVIFAKGYYVQTGEVKLFENQRDNMLFERKIASPNGEDYLYVFYQPAQGLYSLLAYNIIQQEVAQPISCHGFTLFDGGQLAYFKAEDEQKKHHQIQLWQTPFYSPNRQIESQDDSFLYKIGNKEIVRAMAEVAELQKLINKGESYQNVYEDLSNVSTAILDTYHWLGNAEAENIKEPLQQIRTTAQNAIDEYEKVKNLQATAREALQRTGNEVQEVVGKTKHSRAANIYEYVERLNALRTKAGEVLALQDMRYMDSNAVENLEREVQDAMTEVSKNTISFLGKKEALEPYLQKVESLKKEVENLKKATDAKRLQENINTLSADLEMLIEIVSNLEIEDATETTKIIEAISGIFAHFNQVNTRLKTVLKDLRTKEGEAELNAQLKLVNQALTNYLDISDTPEKCEDYRNKLLVQLEELESRFVEVAAFTEAIEAKRHQVYDAFESKKVMLEEQRAQRVTQLFESGERIVEGIRKRLSRFGEMSEIRAYYASDYMVEKVRKTEADLLKLGDSTKADDLASKLKTAYEEAQRQLKDKTELFTDGSDAIRLGKHAFNVNKGEVALSLVAKDDGMYLHISGTSFFEKMQHPVITENEARWQQTLASESDVVYRGEFLAYRVYHKAHSKGDLTQWHGFDQEELLVHVQEEMTHHLNEGYVKGVHDVDAANILKQFLKLELDLGLLSHSAKSRVVAYLFWHKILDDAGRERWTKEFNYIQAINGVFGQNLGYGHTYEKLYAEVTAVQHWPFEVDENTFNSVPLSLMDCMLAEGKIPFSNEGWNHAEHFLDEIKKKRALKTFRDTIDSENTWEAFARARQWVKRFSKVYEGINFPDKDWELETTLLLMEGMERNPKTTSASGDTTVEGLLGDHKKIQDGKLYLSYRSFFEDMVCYYEDEVPAFQRFQKAKEDILKTAEEDMRLSEFKPKVMGSFVRNQLINEVYLPLIGDNLAKQIGSAGAGKRTDLMGLLLLISPPGYGKTTLMEYVANRLGLVFMKINGPAIGHEVTALDPASANNSAAREELEKLNLAFEMGNNVMIYVDDIQHCNPEFLQKFISLCDAQRKVEGVYKGRSKTYDFRGKKVAVVMAGNPYTESGEKFRIPDMLSNRADIYNLGDEISGKSTAFERSYIENCLTSNALLGELRARHEEDIKAFIQGGELRTYDSVELQGEYGAEQLEEYKRLFALVIQVRDTVLRVNKAYIESAGTADEFRTQPAFLLQGSYRDMNKLVEKLSPIITDEELKEIIVSHYENEAQTLTGNAEFNLLKFREMQGWINEQEKQRLAEITVLFQRDQKRKGFGGNQLGALLEQAELMAKSLEKLSERGGEQTELN